MSTDTLLKTLGEIVAKKSTDIIWKQGVNQNDTLIRFYLFLLDTKFKKL